MAHLLYSQGKYKDAQACCDSIYQVDACIKENLLLLGAVHFQLHNYSEVCI